MKTTFTIVSIIAGIFILAGCARFNNTSDTTEVVVIRDITDSMTAIPNADEISTLVNLNKELWNGAKFRHVNLTDVSINKIHETSIDSENEWLGNKFKRRENVKAFYSEITRIVSDASKEKIGKNNSSLYLPIAKELNRLSQSTAGKRVLLIYSDLMENTDEMSFYENNEFNLLKTNPDSVKRYFDSQMVLKNIDGLKIYLVFQPLNIKEDEIYKVVADFYKNLFESKGATVEITASIN
jgi:hypothetical protein